MKTICMSMETCMFDKAQPNGAKAESIHKCLCYGHINKAKIRIYNILCVF